LGGCAGSLESSWVKSYKFRNYTWKKYEKMCGTDRKDWFGEKFAAKPHIVIEIYGMGPWFMMVYTQKKLPMSGWSKSWDPEKTKTN